MGATDARYMGEVIVFIAYEVIQDSATPAIAVIAVVAPFVAQAVITWIMCGYLNLGVGPGFASMLLEDTSGRQGGAISEDNNVSAYGSIATAVISSFAASLLTGATSSFSLWGKRATSGSLCASFPLFVMAVLWQAAVP
jgi:hypothetical protein